MILPQDFKEFLELLRSKEIKYLIVGGYAVAMYGYPRTTGDIDIWIAIDAQNAEKMVAVLKEFGFDLPQLNKEIFMEKERNIRMGSPPLRIEILTSIDGVEFNTCYKNRQTLLIDGIQANVISLEDLKKNKKSSARHRDLDDLENLK